MRVRERVCVCEREVERGREKEREREGVRRNMVLLCCSPSLIGEYLKVVKRWGGDALKQCPQKLNKFLI